MNTISLLTIPLLEHVMVRGIFLISISPRHDLHLTCNRPLHLTLTLPPGALSIIDANLLGSSFDSTKLLLNNALIDWIHEDPNCVDFIPIPGFAITTTSNTACYKACMLAQLSYEFNGPTEVDFTIKGVGAMQLIDVCLLSL